MHWLGLSVALLALVSAGLAADYCNSSLCPAGTRHIACNNNGQFVNSCPANAKMVGMKTHINAIVRQHNMFRNRIASGSMSRYQPARRMASMRWDAELARIAAFNVKQCRMEHDDCRNTATFKHSGQNLAFMSYNGPVGRMTNDALVKQLVTNWFAENKDANMAQINSYPASHSGPQIGHFTVMVADRNIRVGCAAARYTKNQLHYFLLACNYATTNIVGEPIYVSGAAGSGCTQGRNPNFNSLCAPNETYNNL